MPPIGFKRSRALWEGGRERLLWAILYELQPIRRSELGRLLDTLLYTLQSTCRIFLAVLHHLPQALRSMYCWLTKRTLKQWAIMGAMVSYYWTVRMIHHALDAGPLVIILTLLILIFTIGLSDNEHSDGLSAYSVFNKGFQKLLGSVDAEALLQQHVGGGGMAFLMGGGGGGAPLPLANDPPPQQQQQQQAAIARRVVDPVPDDPPPNDPQNEPRPASRRANKKNRRQRNNQRRDLQEQREAARAMGFVGEDGTMNDQAAMNRLVEEQAANHQD